MDKNSLKENTTYYIKQTDFHNWTEVKPITFSKITKCFGFRLYPSGKVYKEKIYEKDGDVYIKTWLGKAKLFEKEPELTPNEMSWNLEIEKHGICDQTYNTITGQRYCYPVFE